MFIGDFPLPEFWTSDDGARIFLGMATAIGRIDLHSRRIRGWCGRQDARRRHKEILSDTERKLFPICDPERTLVYGFMGMPRIIDTPLTRRNGTTRSGGVSGVS
jgi:hypothetical protein